MDLPVFVYSHTKNGLKFLLRQGRCLGQLSIWFTGCQLQTTKIEPYRFLFCLGLSLSRSVSHQGLLIIICIRYLVVSSPLAIRSTTSKISQNCKFVIKLNI